MNRLATFLFALVLFFNSAVAVAGGGGGAKASSFDWKGSGAVTSADQFVDAISAGDYASAYAQGGDILREKRTLGEFTADMQRWGFDRPGTVEWSKGNNALPAKNGFKLMGTYTAADGEGRASNRACCHGQLWR